MRMELFDKQSEKQPQNGWSSKVKQDTSGLVRKGALYCLAVLVAFFLWATFMPIASSVVATGQVVAAAQNKLLQHPSGGVVRKIVAENGTRLKAGDVVLEIDPEVSRADLTKLKSRRDLLQAQKQRFEAERQNILRLTGEEELVITAANDGLPKPKPQPDQIVASTAPAEPVSDESHLVLETEFQARMERFLSEVSSLENQAKALRSEKAGLIPQIENQQALVSLKKKQLEKVRPLVAQKYFSHVRFAEMEAEHLDAESRLMHLVSSNRAIGARIEEVNDKIVQLSSSRKEEYARELATLDAELTGLSEQIKAAEKAVAYTQIRAPSDGVLVKLNANTVGGVIKPGEVIGEIVPASGGIKVEARVPLADIANVHMEQPAKIVVSAFNRRLVDPFEATVDYVAADASIDEMTGERFFSVRLTFENAEEHAKLILPGMAAESYIELGSRSFLGYVMKPISDSFRRAFQER